MYWSLSSSGSPKLAKVVSSMTAVALVGPNVMRLDFAKNNISIEVAFNHGEAIAHNIMKPVLASELNHVQKEIQTKMGVIIVSTKAMKSSGGFDGAVGTFEKFIEYFEPYNMLIPTPIVLIGLGFTLPA